MKVVIAPDSFKGSISNFDAASAIAQGWSSIRPTDELILKPMADGGEGTLETIAFNNSNAIRVPIANHQSACWLLLEDGTAVVELASICGITLLTHLDPMNSNTYLFGAALKDAAMDPRVQRIVMCVGGSASTDGGAGALMALGARFLDRNGESIGLGGAGLQDLDSIDLADVVPMPTGGVTCLTDVRNFLLGPEGAAPVFAPQKGATDEQVIELESGLHRLQQVSQLTDFEGAGAAGGTPFGLSIGWRVEIQSGAEAIATLIGLPEALLDADLVITGEGRYDSQSLQGKVVGTVGELAASNQVPVRYCVGSSEKELGVQGVELVQIAPSAEDAINSSWHWLYQAGVLLAQRFDN